MEMRYRVTYNSNGFREYFESGYAALKEAARFASKCKVKVAERHGKRWFTIATAEKGGEMVYTGKERDYYILPLDQYGQPTGTVSTICLHKAEAIILEKEHGYLFDDYVAACYRADA